MKIIEIRHIEDCFDGSYIKEIIFDQQIDYKFIESLKNIGDLAYYQDFARPFFKLELKNTLTIKGVEGNYTIRVLVKNEKALNFLLTNLHKEGGIKLP